MTIDSADFCALGRRFFRGAAQCHSVLWAAAAFLLTSPAPGQPAWVSKVDEILSAPQYQQAHWGVLVTDLESGSVVYERDADKLFAPASTTKLYSVAAALDAFGPDYRFETPVYARGETDTNGVLHGDLILVASGDLTFGGRTDAEGHIAFTATDHTYANGSEAGELTQTDPLAGVNELARQVTAAGVKRVEGEVVIDDRLFDPAESSGSGPSQLTPILINDDLVDLMITPGLGGALASVTWRPLSAALRIDAEVMTVASNEDLTITLKQSGQGVITVRGQIPVNHKPLVRVAEVPDPASFARAVLIEALRRAGVSLEASPLAANRPDLALPREDSPRLRRVALFRSPPFREELKLILKVSHNLHASALPLLIAAKNGKRTLRGCVRGVGS